MLGIAIVVPCIPVGAVLGTGGSTLATFPPFQCFARSSDVIYYTFILPASIIMGAGLTLIILIFHVIIHVTDSRKKSLQVGTEVRSSVCYIILQNDSISMKG